MSQTQLDGSSPIDSAALFRAYAQFVASFLHRLGARGADLDDLVQDVFVTAHRKGGYRPGPASPTTFLARLALEVRLTRKRRDLRFRSAQSESIGSAAHGSEPARPDHALALSQASQRLQAALDAMDPGARAVFVLFELEGQACETIAAGLQIKLGTVYSRLHNARKTFHGYVARANVRDAGPRAPQASASERDSARLPDTRARKPS